MRKVFYFTFLVILTLFFQACGGSKNEPDMTDHGSVSLKPVSTVLKYGETIKITPSFSDTGEAKNKTYSWKSENSNIVDYKVLTGNIAEATALRIGKTNIVIYSTDGKISAKSEIEVESRTNFLSRVYFKPGAEMSTVKSQALDELNEEESDDKKLVYDIVGNSKIKQEIYYFQDGKLYSTIVILNDTPDIRQEAYEFIEERFKDMNIATAEGIKYYDTSVFEGYSQGAVVGIFLPSGRLSPEDISGKLGVKFTTQSNLPK